MARRLMYRRVLEMVRGGCPAHQIRQELNLTPSRLTRILQSKRVREELRQNHLIAQAMLAYNSCDYAESMLRKLTELTDSRVDESARKACMSVLDFAQGDKRSTKPNAPNANEN